MTTGFNGLNVTAFESRRANEIEKLIRYYGGVPHVAPSIREVPLKESDTAREFVRNLVDEKIDIIIFTTGVGTDALKDVFLKYYSLDKYKKSLRRPILVARGPKPVGALKKIGITPEIYVPEPHTWREILQVFDNESDIRGKKVAVQEYGVSNKRLINGLEEKGAVVSPVTLYKWELPTNIEPLKKEIISISNSRSDIILFTSSQQVYNLLKVATECHMEESLREGIKHSALGSIGPKTTEVLREAGLSIDYEPNTPRMGNLVREMARRGRTLMNKKRIALANGIDTNRWQRYNMVWGIGDKDIREYTRQNSVLMRACRLEQVDYTPIWIMRQAGRFLREYRELRSRVPFLKLCKKPELAAEVTLMAVDRLGVDAAIIFSDILLILEALGIKIEFSKSDGPIIKKPLPSSQVVDAVGEFESDSLMFVYDAIKLTRRALDPAIPLIGFAGAPFTVSSYLIEGGGSKNYINTKALMYKDRGAWDALMQRLTAATVSHLNSQIDAGADLIQIFDSWVGCLSPGDYQEYVLPYMKQLIRSIRREIPVILFGTDTSSLLELMRESGAQIIGLDWRVDLVEAWDRIGKDKAVQGNIDPVVLFANPADIRRRVRDLLLKVNGRPGHIFNLGHGVLPNTPVDNVLYLIDTVHEHSYRLK